MRLSRKSPSPGKPKATAMSAMTKKPRMRRGSSESSSSAKTVPLKAPRDVFGTWAPSSKGTGN